MTAAVFFYNASQIIFGFVAFMAGAFVYYRTRENLVFLLLTAALCAAGTCQGIMGYSTSASMAVFWFVPMNFFWLLVFSLLLHFSIAFFYGKSPKWIPFIYLPSLLMFAAINLTPHFVSGFAMTAHGFDYQRAGLYPLYIVFYIGYSLASLFFLLDTLRNDMNAFRRTQAGLYLLAILMPLSIGAIFNDILPVLGIHTWSIAIHTTTITVWIIAYAIIKYSPVPSLSKELIAEAVSEAFYDGLFLTDKEGIINYVNQAGSNIGGYNQGALLGLPIDHIMVTAGAEYEFKGVKNRVTSVEVKKSPVQNNQGFLYLVRDLTEIVRSREATKKLTSEMDLLTRRENTFVELIKKLLEEKDQKKINAIWEDVQSEGGELEQILKPVAELAIRRVNK